MDFRGFKIHIAVLIMLVTFGALAGASYIYRQQHQERPLTRDLAAVAPVKNVTVTYANNKATVDIQLGQVPDLGQVYANLNKVVARTFGANGYAINVSGDPDQALNDFYRHAQYYVWQGVQQGNYADMAAAIEADATTRGLSGAHLGVTADRVFLQASDAGGHYLYVVVPRAQQNGGMNG
jgi:hypothetical protein